VAVTAGGDIVRDLEMNVAEPAAVFGRVSIATDPPGARITVDGRPSGTSPVTLEELAVGEHTIAVASATGSAEKKVTVAAGHTASVVFSLPKVSGPLGGWLSVSAPFDIQVLEGSDVIGAGGASKIMLAAGRHDLVLANRTLEYQEVRRLEITPGQTTLVRIDAPMVPMNVNARPWAEVTLDGESLGQTPISNATVSVGTHQLAFRHPQLGERRQTVVVTAKGPNRVAVDLTK
jgi:serine/threonine-protein kinase